MNHQALEAAFKEWHLLYSELARAGEHFAAVSKLAAMENCLPLLGKSSQARWRGKIGTGPLPENVLGALDVEIEEAIQDVRRILSFGTKWDSDELLVVCTRRIEIELLLNFLRERGQFTEGKFLEDVDEDMSQIARSKTNKQSLRIAVSLIRKNWGLPITSRWLDNLCEPHRKSGEGS